MQVFGGYTVGILNKKSAQLLNIGYWGADEARRSTLVGYDPAIFGRHLKVYEQTNIAGNYMTYTVSMSKSILTCIFVGFLHAKAIRKKKKLVRVSDVADASVKFPTSHRSIVEQHSNLVKNL